jgi:hypothetical protein
VRRTDDREIEPMPDASPIASNPDPPAKHGDSHPTSPELLEAQRETLARLRQQPGLEAVEVRSVTLVTDSVQMIVEISEHGAPAYHAVIAPSGRVHPL